MPKDLLHVGFGNVVVISRVVSIIAPDSLPVRRMIRETRERGLLIDASRGRKVKSAIILDNGSIVVSALHPGTIARRMEQRGDSEDHADA